MENYTMHPDNIIEVRDLKVNIKIDEGTLTAVRGVNFEIKKGEFVKPLYDDGKNKIYVSVFCIHYCSPKK